MNRTIHLLAAVAIAAAGCTGNPGFDSVSYRKNVKEALIEGRTDSLTLEISAEIPDKPENVRENILTALFGSGYSTLPVQSAIDAYASDYLEMYKEENLPLVGMTGNEISMALSWEKYITGEFTGIYDGKYVNYTVTDYSYTGGAHGMNSETNYIFRLDNGEKVGIDDIFIEGNEDKLSEMIMASLKANGNEGDKSAADYLLVKKIEPTWNFHLSGKGVTFIYNPYEIAAYAAGTIRITVPWKDMKDILAIR